MHGLNFEYAWNQLGKSVIFLIWHHYLYWKNWREYQYQRAVYKYTPKMVVDFG